MNSWRDTTSTKMPNPMATMKSTQQVASGCPTPKTAFTWVTLLVVRQRSAKPENTTTRQMVAIIAAERVTLVS